MKKVNEIKETVVAQEVTQEAVVLVVPEISKEIAVPQEAVVLVPEISNELDVMINDIFAKQIDLDNSKINLYFYMVDMFKVSEYKEKLAVVLIDKVIAQGKAKDVSKAYVNKVKNIVQISAFSALYDLYLFEGRSSNVKAYFYNIEKLVRLFEYLHINYTKDEILMVRAELNKLIKIVNKKEYNDTLAKTLTELFRKYKIVLSDTGDIVKVTLTSDGIVNFLKSLTPEQVKMVLQQASEIDSQNKAK